MRARILVACALAVAQGFSPATVRSAEALRRATPLLRPAQAQQPPPRPTFRTEANFVRVDAYPTQDGRPVDDLAAADFEVLEDGKLQSIQTFERIAVPRPGPQTARAEPNTVRESAAMAADPRARLFVIFLDVMHVTFVGSHYSRQPLITLLNRLIGDEDLVGVMTSDMSATDVTLARRTLTIEGMLTKHWDWGQSGDMDSRDPTEAQYKACYPCYGPAGCISATAAEMILRRREKRTIDALTDLAVHLRGMREERKAIIAVSSGWTLPRPNDKLMRLAETESTPPGVAPIGIDPRTGRLTTRDERPGYAGKAECDKDRMALASVDLFEDFRNLLETANRSNAAFYPINPNGLEVASNAVPIGGTTSRVDSLQTLAENTDGVAIVNTNDLDRGVRRIVDDLSSYYLLGYYSTNEKLDGQFRKITVRVKRPGVVVRARHGYKAATLAEVRAAPAAAGGPAAAAADTSTTDALGVLAGVDRPSSLRLAVMTTAAAGSLWVGGEIEAAVARDEWRAGGEAHVLVSQPNGANVAQTRVPLAPGRRTFLARIDTAAIPPGMYVVQVRASTPGVRPLLEQTSLALAYSPGIGMPMLFRRGAVTTQPFEPAADPRFRRSETIRVQAAVDPSVAAQPTMTLLDRAGHALNVPLAPRAGEIDGVPTMACDLPLASLAAGDYLVRIELASEKRVVAFRIVP